MIAAMPASVPSRRAGSGGTKAVAGAVRRLAVVAAGAAATAGGFTVARRLRPNEALERGDRRQIAEQLAESDLDFETALNLLGDLTEQERVEAELEEGCGRSGIDSFAGDVLQDLGDCFANSVHLRPRILRLP